jgi:predicted RNA-binding protein with TRAM domain
VEISNELLCLFSADVSELDGKYVVEIPRREIETGSVEAAEQYQVALIIPDTEPETADVEKRAHSADAPQPPVEPGEMRYVEIEDIGKQGDGIARVERGYVIIVPDTEMGERVKIEVTEVKSNFAVGEVISETA